MKQYISTSQLNELDDKAKERLGKYLSSRNILWGKSVNLPNHNNTEYHFPVLNIGQMMQILVDNGGENCVVKFFEDNGVSKGLCDWLWEEVKKHI